MLGIYSLERIKATKETQEVIKIVKENVNELLEKRGESPATSSANTKTGTAQQAASSTKSTKGKSPKTDSIFVPINWQGKTKDGKRDSSNSYMKKVAAPKKRN